MTNTNAEQQNTETLDAKKQSCQGTQTIKTEPVRELETNSTLYDTILINQ